MAATQSVIDLQAIGREFARAIEGVSGAIELWVEQHQDTVVLWLIAEDLDRAGELQFYQAEVDLIRKHSDTGIDLRILSPQYFDVGYDLHDALPRAASLVPLSR